MCTAQCFDFHAIYAYPLPNPLTSSNTALHRSNTTAYPLALQVPVILTDTHDYEVYIPVPTAVDTPIAEYVMSGDEPLQLSIVLCTKPSQATSIHSSKQCTQIMQQQCNPDPLQQRMLSYVPVIALKLLLPVQHTGTPSTFHGEVQNDGIIPLLPSVLLNMNSQ